MEAFVSTFSLLQHVISASCVDLQHIISASCVDLVNEVHSDIDQHLEDMDVLTLAFILILTLHKNLITFRKLAVRAQHV